MQKTVSKCAVKLLHLLPPETAHVLAIKALKYNGAFRIRDYRPISPAPDSILAANVLGLAFPNVLGMAAGFDRNAEAPDELLDFGFGFVEVGGVTLRPQAGNPKPRLFRDVANGAVVNRLGFNGQGLEAVAVRLAKRPRRGIVGINIGRNKVTEDGIGDYAACITRLAPLVDYLSVNVSSPNTPGLRDMQEAKALEDLLRACVAARAACAVQPPLLLKIAPDLDDEALAALVETAIAQGVDGLIVGNTTLSRPAGISAELTRENGGLSGRPLFALSTERLRLAFKLTRGRIPLVGVGGIASGQDAYEKIRAGASLLQFYSALVFHGPALVPTIQRDLAALLRRNGFKSVADAVGIEVKKC